MFSSFVEIARNFWVYQYMIAAGGRFVGLVGWLLPHRPPPV